jgi:hypothetical protein
MFSGLAAVPFPIKSSTAAVGVNAPVPTPPFYPDWSLVGTFKCPLQHTVEVDTAEKAIKWHQRNPKGGFQHMRMIFNFILDISLAQVKTDYGAETTVVIRAAAKPTQVAFGFSDSLKANRFKQSLQEAVKQSKL